jgi:hypothetical protein
MAFLAGLQTHFGAPLGLDLLKQIKAFRFSMCRIDAQKTTPDDLRTILAEVQAAGMKPLVIANSYSTLVDLPPGTNVEWMNEPNLKGITPAQYLSSLDSEAAGTFSTLKFWIPAVSNLNSDGLHYVAEVLRLGAPSAAGISVHDYDDNGDGLSQLKALIGTRQWGVSEFGYNAHVTRLLWWHAGLTDAEAAEKIRQRLVKLSAAGAAFGCVYQLNDGATADSRYGIRRVNGTWKPQASAIPSENLPG